MLEFIIILVGFDSTYYIFKEVKDAGRMLFKVIIAAAICNYFFGLVMIITIMVIIRNVAETLA